MSENDLKLIATIQLVAATLMCGLIVSGLIPGTYGVYQWLNDNKALAPWFSGGATTLGVLAALWNADRQLNIALEKERRDEDRAAATAKRVVAGYVTAAQGLLGRTFAAAQQLEHRLIQDPEEVRYVFDPVGFYFLQIQSCVRAFQKFPVHLLEDGYAIEIWYRAEVFLETIMVEMQSAHGKLQTNPKPSAADVKSIKDDCGRVLDNINVVLEALRRPKFARKPAPPKNDVVGT